MRALLPLAAVLLALGLTACGSETAAEPAPQEAVALAASKTTGAGTYKADIVSSIDIAGQSLEMTGTGEFDGDAQRGRVSYSASVAGQDIDVDTVFALPDVYMRYPAGLLPGIPEGKSWIKLDLEKLGREAGFDFGQLMQAGQSDPSQGLQFLRGVTDTQAVGDEDVRGVSTTHYTGVVDLQRLADKDPALKGTVDALIAQAGLTRIPVEVWVDDENFVRRMKQSFEGATFGPGMQLDMTMTTELYDFGSDVKVEVPSPDDVVDLGEIVRSQA
jgi:LppX_LprAFG lipoprotein